MDDLWSEEYLLAQLAIALRAAEQVPPELVEAAKSAFAWRDIDAELAILAHDSDLRAEPAGLTRAESASLRTLTFVATGLTIEIEVTRHQLLGQLVPPQEAEVQVMARSGMDVVENTDEVGFFTVHPIPEGPFRLNCRTPAGVNVSTDWITL